MTALGAASYLVERVGIDLLLRLDEALHTAEQNQPQLRQAQASTEAARARADAARSGLLPSVNANAQYGVGNTRQTNDFNSSLSLGVNANQLIYDFGKTSSRWHAAEANAESQQNDQQATFLNIQLNVRTAYFNASSAKALVAVANTFNIAADLASMGASAHLVVPVPAAVLTVLMTALMLGLEIAVPYHSYARVLRWLALSLLAYLFVLASMPVTTA